MCRMAAVCWSPALHWKETIRLWHSVKCCLALNECLLWNGKGRRKTPMCDNKLAVSDALRHNFKRGALDRLKPVRTEPGPCTIKYCLTIHQPLNRNVCRYSTDAANKAWKEYLVPQDKIRQKKNLGGDELWISWILSFVNVCVKNIFDEYRRT